MLAEGRPDNTTILRLRLRNGDSDRLHARQSAERLLAQVDLRPPGLPANALLVIRHLSDPLPGSLRLRNGPGRISPVWQRALQERLARLLREAALPARGGVPAAAEAVLFSDRSELLACLARDWCVGSVTAQWWWREMLGKGEVARRVWEAWLDAPEFVPAAFELLERMGEAVRFAAALPESAAAMLAEQVALVHGVAAVFAALRVSYKEHPIPDGSQLSTPQAEDRSANREALIPGPASSKPLRFVAESSFGCLGVRQRILLDLALGLRRAPLWVRSQDYADGIAGLLQAEFALHEQPARSYFEDAAPDVAGGQSDSSPLVSEEARETVAPLPGDLNHQPVRKPPEQASVPKSVELLTPRIIVEGSQGAQPALTPTPLPEGEGLFFLLPAGEGPGMRVAETPKSPPVTSLVSTASHSLPIEEEAKGGLLAELPLETRSLAQDEPVVSAPLPLEERGGAEESPKAAFLFPETGTVSTRFGGCFYLVNLGLFLELYGDFTRPLHAGITLSIWDFVALVGERLAGKSLRRDPLWPLLARLAVRRDCKASCDPSPSSGPSGHLLPEGEGSKERTSSGSSRVELEEPGAGFEAPAEWRMPLAWLKPFPTGMNWLATADDLRLRVLHPLDFVVIDVPLDSGDPTEQLSRELAPYAGYFTEPLRVCPSGSSPIDYSRNRSRLILPPLKKGDRGGFSNLDSEYATPQNPPCPPFAKGGDTTGRPLITDRQQNPTGKMASSPMTTQPELANDLDRWLDWLMPYIRARLALGLGVTNPEKAGRLLCRQPAKVTVTAAHLDIHFTLANHPIAIRLSGLDRDPGWVPAAGRSLHFHFD